MAERSQALELQSYLGSTMLYSLYLFTYLKTTSQTLRLGSMESHQGSGFCSQTVSWVALDNLCLSESPGITELDDF